MQFELPIESRLGNWIIVIIGAFLAIAGTALLLYAIVDAWGYGGVVDHLIKVLLIGEIAAGLLFLRLGWLKVRGRRDTFHSRGELGSSPGRRKSSTVANGTDVPSH